MDFKTEKLLKQEIMSFPCGWEYKTKRRALVDEDSKEDYDGRGDRAVLEVKSETKTVEDTCDAEMKILKEESNNPTLTSKLEDELMKEDGRDEADNCDVKPTHSYIALIAMAILSLPSKKMILGDIYQYITENYPYYRNKDKSWRNSIRHNLSLNECFIKAGRSENGKGNYWAIHPANLEDFTNGDFRRRRARRRIRRSTTLKIPGSTSCYLHGLSPFASHSPLHPYRSTADYRPFYHALSYITPVKKSYAIENIIPNYSEPPTMCSMAQMAPFSSEQASGMASHYSTYVQAALPSDYKLYNSLPSSAFSSYMYSRSEKYGSDSWQETLNRLQEQLKKSTAS